MTPSQKTMPGKVDTSKILLSRGLAIVLKKSVPVSNDPRSNSRKKKSRQRKEPVVEDQRCKGCEEISDYEFGPEVFTDWTKENEECYWNPCLVQSVKSLEFKGFVRPTTLLVGGTDYSLEVVRSAWGRRMLRPPNGYDIVMLGDLDPVTMNLVAQTQFAPLPEALCKVVFDLTSEGITASLPVISKRLKTAFPEIMLPTDDILYKTLGTLIRERKLYHTGSGYSVVTPDTFRLLAMSTPIERPLLLTNEEALVRLHGVATDNGTTACTQTKQETLTAWSSAERIVEPRKSGATLGKLKRCHSLKLLRSRDKEKLSRSNSFKSSGTSPGPNIDFRNDIENVDTAKKEKISMFSKLFRRGRSEKNRSKSKGTSSSTQFPPRDWADPDYVLFNSRATQTLDRNEDQRIKGHTRSSSLNRNSSKDRHSIHLSSTPATPRIVHRNSNRLQTADIYHYRSSSLTRKASASPKREYRHTIEENPVPRVSNGYGTPARPQEQVKPRPRYESPFSPFPAREKTKLILTASDKYGTVPNEAPKHHGNVSPYQSTDILKSPPVADKLSFSTPLEKKNVSPGWRRPTFLSTSTPTSTLGSSFKSSPPRIVPRFSPLPRDLSSIPPPKPTTNPQTTTKVITEDFKTTETVTKTFPNASKEVRLGTTVDVEISVNNNVSSQNNKKSLLTTDLDSPVKNDLLKIATTWNHTIKSNSTKTSEEVKKSTTGIPKLTATTNITTSLSHGTTKDVRTNKVETTTNTFLKSTPLIKRVTDIDCSNGRDSPSKDTMCSSSPRSTLTADAKSEFFSDSPNTTTEVHLSKDDSGFSSSASTSRPMSVSPC